VPELSHDPIDDGFHEIQLSGKQLVFLFMVTTVIAVVIFICGVLVGRDVRPTADAAAALTANTEPTPAADLPPAVPAAAPADDPPTPASEDGLQYGKRLEDGPSVPEVLKPRSEPSPPSAPVEAAMPPTSRPEPRGESRDAARSPEPSRSGVWIVQVAALSDRTAAGSIQKRLSAKGYPAFVVSPPPSASKKIYKVQVGRYDERGQADQVARRLEKEEKLSPWISR
jgi:cell division septation protein DedD